VSIIGFVCREPNRLPRSRGCLHRARPWEVRRLRTPASGAPRLRDSTSGLPCVVDRLIQQAVLRWLRRCSRGHPFGRRWGRRAVRGFGASQFLLVRRRRGWVRILDFRRSRVRCLRWSGGHGARRQRCKFVGRGSEEAVFRLQMPRGNRRPVMAGFRFEGGSVGRRPASPGQAWRG
jgi:hypothetical protein